MLVNKTEINFTKLIKSRDETLIFLPEKYDWLLFFKMSVLMRSSWKLGMGCWKIIDGLTKCIKVLTSKSTWWGAETIHLKCYTNTWLHYYGHFSIFVKLIRHKQRCVTTKGEAPDAMNLPCLTYVCTCYFKASFINFYLLFFHFKS